MKDREPVAPSPQEYWDIDTLAIALASEPLPRVHQVHGEGWTLPLGEPTEPTAELQVFPATGLVRYSSEGLTIALTKAVPYTTQTRGSALFNASTPTEARTLFVGDQGEVTLCTSPRDPEPPIAESPVVPDPTILTGRLVTDPIDGRTRHGAPMTRMAIREIANAPSTDVFAFGALAQDAAEYFHKDGEYVFTGERKRYQRGTEPEREIFVLNGMTIGRGGEST